jgi:hypothetical protein
MTKHTYRLLAGDPSTKFGQIEKFPGVPEGAWNLHEGMPLAAGFAPDITWSIAADSGNIIGDFVKNLNDMLVLSRRARDLFESEGIGGRDIEYLPFILKNKKGRVVDATQYCLANPLRKVVCLDKARAKFKATSKGTVAVIKVLELDLEKIPETLKVFRLGDYPRMILLRSDFIERVKAAGLTGFYTQGTGQNLNE